MSKYLTKSAEVLSAADRQEDIIDWILFSNEQNTRIFAEIDEWGHDWWKPGIALYPKPEPMQEGEQYIRPMFEEIPIERFHMDAETRVRCIVRCEPCGTSWAGKDACFICGEEREPKSALHDIYAREESGPTEEEIRQRLGIHFGVDTNRIVPGWSDRGLPPNRRQESRVVGDEEVQRRGRMRGQRVQMVVFDEGHLLRRADFDRNTEVQIRHIENRPFEDFDVEHNRHVFGVEAYDRERGLVDEESVMEIPVNQASLESLNELRRRLGIPERSE